MEIPPIYLMYERYGYRVAGSEPAGKYASQRPPRRAQKPVDPDDDVVQIHGQADEGTADWLDEFEEPAISAGETAVAARDKFVRSSYTFCSVYSSKQRR